MELSVAMLQRVIQRVPRATELRADGYRSSTLE